MAVTILSCSDKVMVNTSENSLSSKIDYKDTVNNTVYFESDTYKMILFALKKDQILKPHSAKMDAPLLMLEGQAKITIGDKEHILSNGESIILPKDIEHGVYPVTNVKFVLLK